MRISRASVVSSLVSAVVVVLGYVTLATASVPKCRVPETRANGTIVLRLDRDCDGLSNRAERRLGTDPRNADTDDDGLSDGDEVDNTGSDPTDVDTDDDGIDDANDDCPTVANSDQNDEDGDGIGDACDSNDGTGDDGDGIDDV